MSFSPYLLWVNSHSTTATKEQWVKWYTEEHVPDPANHGASTRATFYCESYLDSPSNSAKAGVVKPKREHPFLALYQTNFEKPLKSEEYLGIRTVSEILLDRKIIGAGEFNARNHDFIQDDDPDQVGEGT